MDVSNSSDQNTGYRVVGGGQPPLTAQDGSLAESRSIYLPKILRHGHLLPDEYATLELKEDEDASWVEFDLEGEPEPRRVEIPKGDTRHLLVALIPNGDGASKPYVCRRRPEEASGAKQGGSATA